MFLSKKSCYFPYKVAKKKIRCRKNTFLTKIVLLFFRIIRPLFFFIRLEHDEGGGSQEEIRRRRRAREMYVEGRRERDEGGGNKEKIRRRRRAGFLKLPLLCPCLCLGCYCCFD